MVHVAFLLNRSGFSLSKKMVRAYLDNIYYSVFFIAGHKPITTSRMNRIKGKFFVNSSGKLLKVYQEKVKNR